MGVCLYNRGEFDKALDNLQRAPEPALGGDRALFRSVCYYKALVMIRKSQFGSAFMTLKAFADDHDDSEDALMALGLAMLRVPVPPEELNPAKKDLVLRSGRATFLAGEHKYPEAEREYRALLAAYPHTPNVHYEYGIYLYLSTQYEQAITEFKQELQLFPHNPLPNIYLALTHLKIGRFSEALSYAQEAVALDPTTYAAQYALGQSLVKTGDFKSAIDHLEVAAKLDPSSEDVHYALLISYARVGRKTDAEREQVIFQQLKKNGPAVKKGVTFAHQPESEDLVNIN
jgi:tetratricopeptide (TPR) repeat protein